MKILVAEDDDVSRMLLTRMLSPEPGWQVTAVSNGAKAWALLDADPHFDIGVFDLMMPELDGLELISRVRNDPRLASLPVILCTALNDRSTVEQAAALEVNHYITKPFSRSTVLAKVRDVAALQQDLDIVEPAATACARLEISPEDWHAMIAQLIENTTRWVKDAGQTLRKDQVRALGLRANALKGACVNLGTFGLAAQFTRAEIILDRCQQRTALSLQGNLLDPFVFSEVTGIAGHVNQEAGRLEQTLQRRDTAAGVPAA